MLVKNIDKNIQEMMKAKERALSKKPAAVYAEDGSREEVFSFDFTDMASRSVFIRMVSNRNSDELEIIQGGDFGDVFGPNGEQLITSAFQPLKKSKFGYNKTYEKKSDGQIRPISGIKDISVEYKGGYKAIRTANVNWTVSSLDDLDRFLPHFLTIGQSVLLDWGWIYKDKEIQNNLKTFFDPQTNIIDPSVFDNPMPLIYRNNGNYDAIGGVVSNIEYKLNEDGGFDCSTTITSVGISLFESRRVDKETDTFLIKQNEEGTILDDADGIVNAILNLPRIVVHDYIGLPTRTQGFLTWGTKTLRDMFGKSMYGYLDKRKDLAPGIFEEIYDSDPTEDNYIIGAKGTNGLHEVVISKITYQDITGWLDGQSDVKKVRHDMFIRWGWFEDNILSRYTSYADKENNIFNVFRSIEPVIKPDGKLAKEGDDLLLRDVKISNDKFYLLPLDPLKFILPGQVLTSDYLSFQADRFQSGEFGRISSKGEDFYTAVCFDRLMSINYSNEYSFQDKDNDKYGILRNVMVNVKEIQKAFGIGNLDDYSIQGETFGTDVISPPPDLKSAVKNLCKSFSANFHNFWKFEIVEDPFNKNIKVIDTDSFSGLNNKAYTKFDESQPNKVKDPAGIFKFPSFRKGSFVKSQNLDFKIPDSMAVTAMYGSNKNKGNNNVIDTTQNGSELTALDLITRREEGDKKYKNMSPAFTKSNGPHSVGNHKKGSVAQNKIKLDGSFTIKPGINTTWWNRYSSTAAESFKKIEAMDVKEKRIAEATKFELVKNRINLETNFRKQLKNIVNDDPRESTVEEINDLLAEQTNANNDKIIELKKKLRSATQRYYAVVPGSDDGFEFNLFPAGLKFLYKNLFEFNSGNVENKKNLLIPAELSLEIDGTAGITPGDIIQTDYIPSMYLEEVEESPRTFFQLFTINQKVDSSGWSTEVGGKMRINTITLKDLLGNTPEYTPEVVEITTEESPEPITQQAVEIAEDIIYQWKNAAGEIVDDIAAVGNEIVDDVTATTKVLVEDGKRKIQKATNAIEDWADDKKEAIKEEYNKFEKDLKEKADDAKKAIIEFLFD